MSFSDPAIAARTTFPLGTTADFDHEPRVRIVFGVGCSMRAGQLARENGARRVLLVTDPGIVAAGHTGRIQGYLEAAGLELVLELPPEPVWVNGDATRLAQVAGNLLQNAAKFTDPGGRVTVQLALPSSVSPCLRGEESFAILTVQDTGIGISENFLPQAFDRFTQQDGSTTRSTNGLGLGLWIVRHIIETHGGSVEAANNRGGQGCR